MANSNSEKNLACFDRLKAFIPIAAAVLLIFVSCGISSDYLDQISLDETPLFSSESSWGVVTDAYARAKKDPSHESEDIGYIRKGDVVEITGKEYGKDKTGSTAYWVMVRSSSASGWIPEGSVARYSTKAAAENAAEKLK